MALLTGKAATIFVAALLAGLAHGNPKAQAALKAGPTRSLQDVHVGKSKPELKRQMAYSLGVIEHYKTTGHWKRFPRHATCWSYLGKSAARMCNRSRERFSAHRWLFQVAKDRYDKLYVPHEIGDYMVAVAYVERYYGPQSFLRNCPASEGGYGGWVSNTGGSGAGGWLQFMSGTFYGIIDKAIVDARKHGMLVPPGTRSWYSPLGQALAGRQMVADGRSGEWTGGTCGARYE